MSGVCNETSGYTLPCGQYQGVNWCCSSGKICCVPMGLSDLRMLCCDPVDFYNRRKRCCKGSDYASCCSSDQICSNGQCSYPPDPDPSSDNHTGLILGITIPAVIIAIIFIYCLCFKKKKKEHLLS